MTTLIFYPLIIITIDSFQLSRPITSIIVILFSPPAQPYTILLSVPSKYIHTSLNHSLKCGDDKNQRSKGNNSKQKQSKNGPLIKLEVESGAMKE